MFLTSNVRSSNIRSRHSNKLLAYLLLEQTLGIVKKYLINVEPNVHRVCDMNLVCIKHEPSSLVMKKSIRKHNHCLKKAKIAKQNFKIVNGSSQSAEIKIRDNEDNRIKYEWSKF